SRVLPLGDALRVSRALTPFSSLSGLIGRDCSPDRRMHPHNLGGRSWGSGNHQNYYPGVQLPAPTRQAPHRWVGAVFFGGKSLSTGTTRGVKCVSRDAVAPKSRGRLSLPAGSPLLALAPHQGNKSSQMLADVVPGSGVKTHGSDVFRRWHSSFDPE